MAFDRAKFITRFVEEAREHCARINGGLLALEKSPGDKDVMDDIFRSAHTVKGSSRMIKLFAVTELAHKMEDLLDALRNGRVAFSSRLSDLLFSGVDAVNALLDKIVAGEETEAPAELCEKLGKAALEGVPSASPEEPFLEAGEAAASAKDDHSSEHVREKQCHSSETIRVQCDKLDELIRVSGEISSSRNRLRRIISSLKEAERLAAKNMNHPSSEGDADGDLAQCASSMRILLKQAVESLKEFEAGSATLIEELHEASLRMRMLPISSVFDTFPRAVRDMAATLGKEIDFTVHGGETELDKKIIEKIGDPLMHMIRNSVDHGIGMPDERERGGKNRRGTISLSAFYDGGNVSIVIRDDGRGISPQKVREKALQKNMYDEETLARMSESEVIDIIFQPGFSTSQIISDFSGRGVGLDVARQNIVEGLKGSVHVESFEGIGTSFHITVPLTLALFRLLLVSAGGRQFALPAISVREIVTVRRSEIIDVVHKNAIRLREQLVPVEELGLILKAPGAKASASDEVLVVVVFMGGEKLGLIVDCLINEENMIVKPLPGHMSNLSTVSGVTLGESNEVINVLHVPALIRGAREIRGERKQDTVQDKKALTILVVDDSLNTREIEKNILEAYGYCVVLAGDGMEALEKTRENVYDLVITDVEMPRLDGFSLTERLRGDDRYRDIPVIIVTSREKEEDKRRGIMVGANAYIVKGAFDQSNLLETVQNLIG